MRRFGAAIRRWGWLFLVLAGAALTLIFTQRKREYVAKDVTAALDVVRAEAEASRLRSEKGKEAALDAVKEEYHEELKKLDRDQTTKAAKLAKDPERLAGYLANLRVRRSVR